MLNRPDILILSLNYPPEPTGIAPYTGALADGLSKKGFAVASRVAHPHYPKWAVWEGYGQWFRLEQVNGVEVGRLRHYVPRTPRGMRRLASEISFGLRLLLARWGRPRVVIAVSPSLFSSALAVLRLRLQTVRGRPRIIVWVQDIYTLGLAETGEGNGIVQRVARWVESRTLRAADQVVVIHSRFRDFIVEELGVSPSSVVVVRNWTHLVPSPPVDPRTAKDELGWPADVTVAVHSGNMGVKQGLENIIEAARLADQRAAPVHFILLGDGSERQMLELRAQGISRLAFVDPLEGGQYPLALSAADVLLVNEKPGVAAMAVPSKLTSYFSAGRPIIAATDPGGITASEVIEAGAGVVVAARQPAALLEAVLTVAADAESGRKFGLNAMEFARLVLGQEAAISRWVDLIEELKPADASK